MAVRSKNLSKNHEFDFVCPFLHIKMPFIASNHTYYQRRYIPLHIETDFSPPSQIVSEYQHQSWKMLKNGHFHPTGALTLHVARVLLQTTHYTLGHSLLYQTVFTACLYDHPLPSNRPGIRALQARFFAIFVFPVSNVKRMAHVITCHGRPVARTGFKI